MTSTRAEVEIGYDLSNEFFRLWLDERMHYTSAVFDEQHSTLEQAQRNKSRWLADFAEVRADSLVMDIGCGWFLAPRRCRARGKPACRCSAGGPG